MSEDSLKLRADRIKEVQQWAHTQFLDPRWHLLQADGGIMASVLQDWVLAPVRITQRSGGTPMLLNEVWEAVQRNMKIDFGMLYDRINISDWESHMRRMKMLLYDVVDSTLTHPSGGFYWNPRATAVIITRSGQAPLSIRHCYRSLGYSGGTHPDVSHPAAPIIKFFYSNSFYNNFRR